MDDSEAPQTNTKQTTLLAVLASAEDDVYPFDKIVSSSAFQNNEAAKKFVVKTTTYEKFLDGSKEDMFDFVLLTFMKAVSSDDLEMKQDYYDYYTQVPIVHYAVANAEQDEAELQGVNKYLKETCDKRLWKGEPLKFADVNNVEACVEALVSDLEGMAELRGTMFDEKVKPAFKKFDKDGNGTIDAQELGALCGEVGHSLNEEQLEAAMKDLDLNGDGVIDEDEFSRWYFTGMKSYGDATRSMLQMRNQTSTIFDVLAKEDIQKIINEDKSMTKHRIKIQFNDPPESYYAEIIYHLLGPFTEKMIEEDKQFCGELGDAFKESPGEKTAHVFLCLEIAMKPGQKAKYEEQCTKLMQLFEENKPSSSPYAPTLHLRMIADDAKITAKFLVVLPETINPLKSMEIPVGLREGLKDVDQYIKMKAVFGADAEEILSSDKPLLEHYLKGFSMQIDVVFLKQIKAALLAGLEGHKFGDKIKEGLAMAGPAFSLNSNFSLELTFDDMEEIKAHPMASTVLVSLDQLLQGILGKDKETIMKWQPDFSSVDKAALDTYVANTEYCKDKKAKLDMFQFVGSCLEDFDPDCKIYMKGSIFGLASIEYKIEGAGYGDLVNLVYKAITLGFQQELVDRIITDFNERKADDGNDAPMGEPMGM